MKYSTVLFDLDGTLLDTKSGIAKTLPYTLDLLGLPPLPEEKLGLFLGPPLKRCYTDVCGLDEETAEKAVEIHRRYQLESGNVYDCRVFEGIEEQLRLLKADGVRLGVASSKADHYIAEILRRKALADYFDAAKGSPADNPAATKADVIRTVLRKLKAAGPTVLIGDRIFDAEGARDAKVDSVGVLYGYGSREEIEHSGFTYIASRVCDIYPLLSSLPE